jgi:hypothetical protein
LGRGASPRKEHKVLTTKLKVMKLTKFSMQKMTVAEMTAIKAGSGASDCGGTHTSCSGSDHDTGSTDWD